MYLSYHVQFLIQTILCLNACENEETGFTVIYAIFQRFGF